MERGIQDAFGRMDALKQELIGRVRGLPPNLQTQRPSPKEWSPAEVIDHCATAEELYLKWMDDAESSELDGKVAKRSLMFKGVLYTLRKAIRVPALKEMEPRVSPSVDEAIQHWDSVRERYRTLFADKRPDEVLLKHPAFGYMSAAQILEVFEAHAHYHNKRFPVKG